MHNKLQQEFFPVYWIPKNWHNDFQKNFGKFSEDVPRILCENLYSHFCTIRSELCRNLPKSKIIVSRWLLSFSFTSTFIHGPFRSVYLLQHSYIFPFLKEDEKMSKNELRFSLQIMQLIMQFHKESAQHALLLYKC